MNRFVVRLVKCHGRAGQERQAAHFVEHGTTHTAVGEVFKLHTFDGVECARCFEQTNHANLDQLVEFHEGRNARFEMQGNAFDQA